MSDLSAPLTSRKARRLKAALNLRGRHLPLARIAFGLVGLLALVVVGRVLLVDDPQGGRPKAIVEIAAGDPAAPAAGTAAADGGNATITADPEPVAPALDPVPPSTMEAAVDQSMTSLDLVEETEFGAIPKMSATGETPFATYARASDTVATAGGKPLIAVIVSGLGINPDGTLDAIDKLPEDVTLAFAPYGKSLSQSVNTARNAGHEVFLEVPLEPFDYPDNDPGPDTLLTGQAPRDNLNKLFHVMSRFGGYVGIINNMGARFTASGADFGPMMEELGARGLGYLDDGSSNRSLAPQLARANRVPFSRVDIALDANPARAPILEQLAALEAKARENGSAIGIITALPVSIDTISEWARSLDEKGLEMVPASALMKE